MSRLTLAQANKIIEVAFAKAREMKVKPLAVAVLDESGNVRSLQRQDEASMLRNEVAIGKAWAAVGMGVSSAVLLERAKGNPSFFGALSATSRGRFIPQTGAVVIKDKDGTILGAAGASGGTGEEDEAVCIAGIEAAGLVSG
ncbi:MAG TPA: heme-binding protein [Reyranella sp.]|nr:heme-binding protein [Reyranella sp.]